MNELMMFEYGFYEVRTVMVDGEPWFVAKDIAVALGYGNPPQAIRIHCKRPQPVGVLPNSTLAQQTIIISESDVYRLILKCTLPGAERFEEWLMEEVLPSIRKTGGYTVQPQASQDPMVQLANAVLLSQKVIAEQTMKIERDAPKVAFVDEVVDQSKGLMTLGNYGRVLK